MNDVMTAIRSTCRELLGDPNLPSEIREELLTITLLAHRGPAELEEIMGRAHKLARRALTDGLSRRLWTGLDGIAAMARYRADVRNPIERAMTEGE